jgi:hypothetical protein
MKHRTFAALCILVMFAVIVAPAAAAPPRQAPEPPFDPVTGEEIQTFQEFGPPDAGGPMEPSAVPAPLAMPSLAAAPVIPAGDLPSYDQEALDRFDVQKVLESDRHLAIDIGPRVTGTPQEQAAAEYFGAKLASYGYTVSYQHWAAGTTKNVATVTSPNADLQGGPDQTLGGPNWQMARSTSGKITGDAEAVEAEVIYVPDGTVPANFPADTAGKIVMMNYTGSSGNRNLAVTNAVNLGAAAVILAQSGTSSPPSFTLTTPQPDVPVVGAGGAHRDWISALIDAGVAAGNPLRLRIATFTYPNPQGTNVVAVRHAVNDPDGTTAPIIMVGGHIDGVLGAPAAHDNGTGPSTAVEVGRILAQYALDKEIRIVGYGGEEIGMYGSRAYVASLTQEERTRFVGAWDMDMEGTPYAPAQFWMLTPNGQSNFVVQSGYDAATRLGFNDLQNCRLGQSDHQSFYDAGIPASLFIWLWYRPNANGCGYNGSYTTEPQYHRPTDTMSNVSPERLEVSLKVVGGAAFHSALNAVTLAAAAGVPVSGAAVEADCGDGERYLGETGADGTSEVVIPHATCDFTATKGLAMSRIEDAAIAGDASLTFPSFYLPEPVLLHSSVDPAHGAIGEDWASCNPLDTDTVGAKTVTCVDGEGSASEVHYNVIYAFSGFAPPVDDEPTMNTANAGQAIPVKWRLADAFGVPVSGVKNAVVTVEGIECPASAASDQIEEYATGAAGLQVQGSGNYLYNWKTPKNYAGACKVLTLDLGEGPGMEHIAQFQFVK